MGNLIIKRVIYSGEKYSFTSPVFSSGINIIVGDNGSGKSTFSYFITYGLGGSVIPFNKVQDGKKMNNSKYSQIINDSNNYVQLEIIINGVDYILKRFIGKNDVFFSEKGKINKLPIKRDSRYAPRIFSDWIMEKLNIQTFSLSLGNSDWIIGFNDFYRLLNHDQDSDPRKIFKSPAVDNFIADSSIIRKTIFETLIGVASQEYNIIFNEYKKAQRIYNESKSIFDNFSNRHPYLEKESFEIKSLELEESKEQLKRLNTQRDTYQKQNTNSTAKIKQLTDIQTELINLELKISENTIIKNNYNIEKVKVDKLLNTQRDEISQIEKIIFTHKKLNLFSFEICPFCMSEIDTKKGFCICGSEIKDDDFEKFVYKSSEYKEILDHKKKSINSIEIASHSYINEIHSLEVSLQKESARVLKLKDDLKLIIDSIEFSGNSHLIDQINDKILEIKESILSYKHTVELLQEKIKIKGIVESNNADLEKKKKLYKDILRKFNNNNKETIIEFNNIYSKLLAASSCSSNFAEINDDYMPYIDHGEYKEKSTVVPIRLMYYFTLLSMGLKRDTVKHPRFLLIDTPEEGGIDKSKLKLNLRLLDNALKLSKNNSKEKIKNYQVILTTGKDKYPDQYNEFVKLTFSKDENNFILKEV